MLDPDDPIEEEAGLETETEPSTVVDDDGLELDPEAPDEVVAAILDSSEVLAPAVPVAESRLQAESGREAAALNVLIQQAVDQLGDRIELRLAGLQAQFEREARAEANRERVVDRLHAELQEYKQDLLLKIQRPIFIDLIQLHDDLGKLAEAQPRDGSGESVLGVLGSIQTAVEDVLYRQGVEPFRLETETFDPRRQRAVTTVATDDPAVAKTVAQRLRPGFQAGDKTIRPELVAVYMIKG